MKHETRYGTQRRHTPWTALCSLFALAIPFAQLDAQQLTRDEVMSRALQFFHDSSASSQRRAGARGAQSRSESELEMIASSAIISPDSLALDAATGQPLEAFYVVRPQDAQSEGFVIVSADERMHPILGYSYDNRFETTEMPDNVVAWLTAYASESRAAAIVPAAPASILDKLPLRTGGVAPLVKTHWGQDTPYNDQCPMDGGRHSVTGCVATAMAQVMKYHEWPTVGHGTASYTHKYLGTLSATIEGTRYDWANMKNEYDTRYDWDNDRYQVYNCTQQERDAVSLLMWHCGASLSMDYSAGASGASTPSVGYELIKHFGYDPDILTFWHDEHISTIDYYTMLIREFNASRPIVYASGSHCYIADGYETRANAGVPYIHLNLGWQGSSDGYYLMNANPSSSDVTFYDHVIITGIQPDDGLPRPVFKFSSSHYPELTVQEGCTEPLSFTTFFSLATSRSYDYSSTSAVRFLLVGIDQDNREWTLLDVSQQPGDYVSRQVDVSHLPAGEYRLSWRSQMPGQTDYTPVIQAASSLFVFGEAPHLVAAFASTPSSVINAADYTIDYDVTNLGTQAYNGKLELHFTHPGCSSMLETGTGISIPAGETVRVTFTGPLTALGDDPAVVTIHDGIEHEALTDAQGALLSYTADCRPMRAEVSFWGLYVGKDWYDRYFINSIRGLNNSLKIAFDGEVGTALLNADGEMVKVFGIGTKTLRAYCYSSMGESTDYSYFSNTWKEFPADVPDGEYGLRLVTRQKNTRLWLALAPPPDENEEVYDLILRCVVKGTQVTIYDAVSGSTTITRKAYDGTPLPHHASVQVEGPGTIKFNYEEFTAGTARRVILHNAIPRLVCWPDPHYRVKQVMLNGDDVTSQLTDGALTLAPVTADQQLRVVFEPHWGEANGDGEVNVADLTSVIETLNGCMPEDFSHKTTDLNANGYIDEQDVRILALIIANGGNRDAAIQQVYAEDKVKTYQGQRYVNLGLKAFPKLRWAMTNLGASSASTGGDYFAWGETAPKSAYYDATYLDTSDDAAKALWGGKWRLPSPAEWQAVLDECDYDFLYDSDKYGLAGYEITGPNGNTIFLPVGSPRYDNPDFWMILPRAAYWSNALDAENTDFAQWLIFDSWSNALRLSSNHRYLGAFIRPVFTE